jgi:hypothetical protein
LNLFQVPVYALNKKQKGERSWGGPFAAVS